MMTTIWQGMLLAAGWSLGGLLVLVAFFALVLVIIGCVFALAGVLDGVAKLRKRRVRKRRVRHG